MTTTFFQEPETITLRDVEIKVSPLAVKHVAKAAKAAAPIMGAITSGEFSPMDIAENADSVIELAALASDQTEEWVGNLNLAELTALFGLVVKVNANFFIRQAMPQIQEMMKQVGEIAKTQTEVKGGKKA
jgi:hypothetical protein